MSAAILLARMRARGSLGGGCGGGTPARPARGEGGPGDTATGPRDVEELCRRFATVCESAADPLEICCALEFEGWSDKAVRDSYGIADVFTLAEQMFLRVPTRRTGRAAGSVAGGHGRAGPARAALRAATVCFPAAAGLLAGPGVVGLLVVVSLVSWAISQSLAYLGYLRLGQADPARAAGRRAGRT